MPGATESSTSRLPPKAKLKITITKMAKTSTEDTISLVLASERISFQAITRALRNSRTPNPGTLPVYPP